MSGLLPNRANPNDAGFLTCLDKCFRPEIQHDWPGIINPANKESDAWVARVGGLYVGYLVLAKEAALAYPTDQFVNPRYETYDDQNVAKALLDKATDLLLIKEGVVVLGQAPEVPSAFEVPEMVPVIPIRGLQPQA